MSSRKVENEAQLSASKRLRSRLSPPRLWTARMLVSPSSALEVVVAPAAVARACAAELAVPVGPA